MVADVPDLVLANKVDLVTGTDWFEPDWTPFSAMTGEGFEALKARLRGQLGATTGSESDFTARRRHLDALARAATALQQGRHVLENGHAGELLAEELKHCQHCLGEITGEFTADDLLGEIFSRFCIGK